MAIKVWPPEDVVEVEEPKAEVVEVKVEEIKEAKKVTKPKSGGKK